MSAWASGASCIVLSTSDIRLSMLDMSTLVVKVETVEAKLKIFGCSLLMLSCL